MKLRTLIVDDERPARKKIRHFLQMDHDIESIEECENGAAALQCIASHSPDLVFLDIQMPDLDGFGFLKRSGINRPFAVVFVTAFDEFAVKAFEANAVDYLLKPFTRKRFEEALRKVKQQVLQTQHTKSMEHALALLQALQKDKPYLQRVAVKSERGIAFLRSDEIDWIESEDNYVVLHAGKQTHLVRESMTAMQQSLDPSRFLRIHRRILVNVERIREMHPQRQTSLILQNGSILPVSRRMKQKVKRFLLNKHR